MLAKMVTLRNSPASPFGRKVVVALNILGLADKVQTVAADTISPDDSIRLQNPLGKIPTLMLEDGQALYDSRVIIEYLNELDGRHILIPQGPSKIEVLRQQALADGILDASILRMYEIRFRPTETHSKNWLDHQIGKVDRSMIEAAKLFKVGVKTQPHIGEITMACVLGYLDFRFAGSWRLSYPTLVAWFEEFHVRVPSFSASTPK
jgi:glutathione S-transferase